MLGLEGNLMQVWRRVPSPVAPKRRSRERLPAPGEIQMARCSAAGVWDAQRGAVSVIAGETDDTDTLVGVGTPCAGVRARARASTAAGLCAGIATGALTGVGTCIGTGVLTAAGLRTGRTVGVSSARHLAKSRFVQVANGYLLQSQFFLHNFLSDRGTTLARNLDRIRTVTSKEPLLRTPAQIGKSANRRSIVPGRNATSWAV
jgi:hypothetical protein